MDMLERTTFALFLPVSFDKKEDGDHDADYNESANNGLSPNFFITYLVKLVDLWHFWEWDE